MNKNEVMVTSIIGLIGGKKNVSFITHCISRLRFNLKDKSLANPDKIKQLDGVLDCFWSGDQFQVVIGMGVNEVYDETYKQLGMEQLNVIEEAEDGDKVEKFLAKRIPSLLKSFLQPFLTVLIMAPVMLIVLAPLGSYIGDGLASVIMWVYGKVGFVGIAFYGAVYPFMVVTGMHFAVDPALFNFFATLGYDPVFIAPSIVSNFNLGVSSLAVAIKEKNENIKATAFSSGVTSIVAGVCEPSLYGVALQYKTPLIATVLGNVAGAIIIGIFQVKCYTFPGSTGIFGFPSFISQDIMNLVYFVIAIVVGVAVAFITTLVLYKPQKE